MSDLTIKSERTSRLIESRTSLYLIAFVKSKLSKFTILGVFLNFYTFILNVILIEFFNIYEPVSYGIGIATGMVISFTLSRRYVFDAQASRMGRTFVLFVIYAIAFRVLDLLLFTLQVEGLSMFYLYAQVLSRSVTFVMKYVLYRRLFEGAPVW